MATYDLAIIGSGPGGYVCAIRAGQNGLKTVVIEKDPRVGGTCTLRGCIPTKAVLHSADVFDEAKHGTAVGVKASGVELDMNGVRKFKEDVASKSSKGIEFLFRKNKVERLHGHGRLLGPGKVSVTGADGKEQVVEARHVVIATGSAPRLIPGITLGPKVMTSDELLENVVVPRRLIVLGAGAVGVEFASMYQDLGVKTTLLEYLPQIVPLEDREVSQALERSLTRRGMTVMTNARFDTKTLKKSKDGVSLMVGPEGKEPAEVKAEMLLVATGRAPNTENVGLESTRAEVDRGFVKVDLKTMRTREPHLYAIGDIVGGLMLAHTAGHEGLLAAHTIAGDKDTHPMDYVAHPRATYCRPEIASVGLTEQQCKDQGIPYKVGKVPFQAIAKAIIGGEYEGFAKVIGNPETGDTLGVHIIGPHATDLISEATLAFSLDATPWEIGGATHAHPTLAEIIGEAAMAVDGRSINF